MINRLIYIRIRKFFIDASTGVRILQNNLLFLISRIIDYPLIPPDSIQLNFLYRCNLSCRMCKMGDRDYGKELPLEVLNKIVNEASGMGIKEALILGGEPFLRPDLYDLIKHVNSKNMRSIVVTNGTLLTDENLKKVKESQLFHIVISLDAPSDEVMTLIRGKGVFDRVLSNVERFQRFKQKNQDFSTSISNCVTIMHQNIRDLYNIVMLSKKIGFHSVVFQPVVFDNTNQIQDGFSIGTGISSENMDIMENSINELIAFKKASVTNYDYIINSIKNLELIKKYFKGTIQRKERPCYAGFNRFQATQDLKVYFCVAPQSSNEVSFGNLQADNIKNLWYSTKAKQCRESIRKSKCCCMQRCAYRDNFEFMESIFEKLNLFGWLKVFAAFTKD